MTEERNIQDVEKDMQKVAATTERLQREEQQREVERRIEEAARQGSRLTPLYRPMQRVFPEE
jgi:hypothetical protein